MRAFFRRNAVPLSIGIGSRVISVALLAIFGSQSTGGWPRYTDAESAFAAWDGQWFLAIAADGYHAAPLTPIGDGGYHDFAFFPLWPLLVRVASLGVLPVELVAVLLANGLFTAATIPVYRLFQIMTGEDAAAARGVTLLAVGPAAYVWSMAYSESLFLLLAAWALITAASRLRRPWLIALAQLTRLTGSALSVAILVRCWARRGVSGLELASIAAGPVAFLAWVAWVGWLTGDPTGYLQGSPAWYQLTGASAGLASLWEGALNISPYFVVAAITTAAVGWGAVRSLSVDIELGTYAVTSVAATVLLANWVNMPRHALVAVPAYAVLGRWLPAGRAGLAIVGLAVIGQVVLVSGAIRWASFPP